MSKDFANHSVNTDIIGARQVQRGEDNFPGLWTNSSHGLAERLKPTISVFVTDIATAKVIEAIKPDGVRLRVTVDPERRFAISLATLR